MGGSVTRRLSSGATALWIPALAAIAAVSAGGLAGVDPKLGLLAALGIAFVVLVFVDLALGFSAMVLFAFIEGLPSLGTVSPAKVVGVVLVGSWLALLATSRGRVRNFFAERPGLTYLMALFLAWTAISIAWSESRPDAITSVTRYALNLLLIPIAYSALRDRRDLVRTFGAIVVGAALAATTGILQPPDPESAIAGRAAGTLGDPNELAAALVVGAALATAFAVNRGFSVSVRLACGAVSVLCVLGILVSLSRGGLVALAATLVASVVVAGRWRVRIATVAVLVAVAAFGYFSFFASLPAKERVTNVGGGTGRVDLWTVGARMVEAHPILGVGTGQFIVVSIHYLLQPGALERGDLILSTPMIAHNTYLQAFAELGAVGGALFMAIVLFCVGCTWRTARLLHRLGDVRLEILVRGLLAGICGYLVALLFISENYSKLLWVLLALGPTMLAVARETLPSSAANDSDSAGASSI